MALGAHLVWLDLVHSNTGWKLEFSEKQLPSRFPILTEFDEY